MYFKSFLLICLVVDSHILQVKPQVFTVHTVQPYFNNKFPPGQRHLNFLLSKQKLNLTLLVFIYQTIDKKVFYFNVTIYNTFNILFSLSTCTTLL